MNLTAFRKSEKSAYPHYLLFGNPVGHSVSPLMHNMALEFHGLEARYYALDILNSELSDLAAHLNEECFLGANVTIPYKKVIVDYLDVIDPLAEKIGAVNTVARHDFRLKGYNTDSEGFASPLRKFEHQLEGGRAVVFGTGGASRAIVAALQSLDLLEIYLISRKPARRSGFEFFETVEVISYDEWPALAREATLVVNATPLGMHPKTDQAPVRETEKQFLADSICYDIIYNPLKTKFLRMAEEVGATTIGGLEMLIQQGNKSFHYWTGKSFPLDRIRNKLYEELKD